MSQSILEAEVMELRARLEKIAERVRIDSVAQAFLANVREVREGDYFLLDGSFPTRLTNVSSEGKWTYFDGHHSIEPFAIPMQSNQCRLYTIEEVAEIISKATRTIADNALATVERAIHVREAIKNVVLPPHAFRRRESTRFEGPPEETCEYCGCDPRNTIHIQYKPVCLLCGEPYHAGLPPRHCRYGSGGHCKAAT